MRIVHLTSVHTYNDTRIFTRMCKSLAAAGNEVHLIVPAAQLPPEEVCGNVRLHAVPPPRNRYERMTLTCWRVWKLARAIDADVYHFHDPELIPAGLALQWSGRKVIFDVHEHVPAEVANKKYIPKLFRGVASKLVACCVDFACQRFSAIVTAGDDISQTIRQTRVPVITIHNYPDLEILDQYTAPQTQPSQMIFFGGIRSNDVALNIVRALALIPAALDVRLTLGGPTWLQSRYQQICVLPGWQRIDYVGNVNYNEMLKLTQGGLGAIVLYANEPNAQHLRSNRLFESMALKLPVVTPNFPRWQSFMEEYRCGIAVDPDQPQEIAEAIIYLLDHPQEAREMGRRGRKVIEESWNWDHEFPKLEALYDKLIASDTNDPAGRLENE